MNSKIPIILTLLFCTCIFDGTIGKDYRLHDAFIPLDYNIILQLDNSFVDQKMFNGTVEITIQRSIDNAKSLRMHRADDLTIITASIEGTPISIKSITYDNETEIMEFLVPETITQHKFKLNLEFDSLLHTDMQGFYLSQVGTSHEYIATTHFHPTYARRAFPCFDEPFFKANFSITLIVPQGYHALSNQPADSPTDLLNGYLQYKFAKTPKMSTYLLAFVVSNFTSQSVKVKTDVPMTIWAPNDTIHDATFAAELSYKVIEHLGNQLNTKLLENIAFDTMGLRHLDQVAIPDFVPGAMENWGLVMYRLNELLWNQTYSTAKDRETVATVITHEFSHNWFGNLVTTSWWNTSWLNEGFARYFQYHGVKGLSLFEEFDLERQFLHEVHTVMEADATAGEQPLTSEVETVPQIKSKFGLITYSKGGAIVKMLRNLAGVKFLDYLNSYILKYRYESVIPENLFTCFTEKVSNEEIQVIMKNWVRESGYPVVYLQLLSEVNNMLEVTLSQEKFLYKASNTNNIKSTLKWYIPISYHKNGTIQQTLMKPESNLTLSLTSDSFIINPERRDYYRVNYEPVLWQRIVDILLKNHTSIDTMTRVQLIDDVMNLARGARVPYTTAFSLLEYLKEETEYHPWMAAFNAFGYLERRFGGDPLAWTHISEKLSTLMFNFWDDNKAFYIEKDSTAILIYSKALALEWRCKLGNQDCNTEARHQFDSIRTRLSTIDPNLQYIVYCSALRHANSETEEKNNFDFLWEKYQKSLSTNEKNIIRTALGCVKTERFVQDYLGKTLGPEIRAQDASNVYLEVLAVNPENINPALEFLNERFPEIFVKYGSMGGLSKVITSTAERLNTDDQYAMFKIFLEKNAEDLGDIASNAIEIVETNRDWLLSYKGLIKDYFTGNSGNHAKTLCFSYALLCFIAFINLNLWICI